MATQEPKPDGAEGPQSQRLFVTKIAPQITRQDVTGHFQQFGTITDVYLPFIPGRPGHKGFAFVSFSDEQALQLAMANAPHVINGAEVVVDLALSRQPMTGATPAGPSQRSTEGSQPSDRIFVTRVPLTMATADVQNYFAQFGEIRDCYMPANVGHGGHKGFAFISFLDPEASKAATQDHFHEINGNTVVVERAIARHGHEKAMKVNGFGMKGGFKGGWQDRQQGFDPEGKTVPGRLFVTRIHQEITKAELEGYFGQYGELEDVYMPGKGSSRIAFVQFKVPTVAQQVVSQLEHVVKPGASIHVDQAIARGPSDGKGKGWGAPAMGHHPAPAWNQNWNQNWNQQSSSNWGAPGGFAPYGMMDPGFQMYQQQAGAGQGFMRFNPYR